MGSGTLACDSYSPKLDPTTTGAPSVETHTYGLVEMSGKMENHRERGVIKCFTRFSSKDATSSGTWVFRVECLDLLPESFRILVSGLSYVAVVTLLF